MHEWMSRLSGLWHALLPLLFASVMIGPHAAWDADR